MSRVVAILVVVSTFGAINGTTLVVSRLAFAMSRDAVVPRAIGVIHPRLGTPVRAIVAGLLASLVYVIFSDFQRLLGLFTFSVWLFYGLTTVALVILRRRRVGEPLTWRAPGGWIPPGVVILTALFMTVSLLTDPEQRALSLLGCALLAAGGGVYLVWRRVRPASS